MYLYTVQKCIHVSTTVVHYAITKHCIIDSGFLGNKIVIFVRCF